VPEPPKRPADPLRDRAVRAAPVTLTGARIGPVMTGQDWFSWARAAKRHVMHPLMAPDPLNGTAPTEPPGTPPAVTAGCEPPHSQQGFSLIEAIIALIILSAIAGLVFSLLGAQFALAGRVDQTTQATLTSALGRERLSVIVEGLVPAWPDDPDGRFRGGPAAFSGLTSVRLEASEPRLRAFSVELVDPGATVRLRSGGVDITTAEMAASAGAFSYMDQAGLWHDQWPPAKPSDFGRFDDSRYAEAIPLPAAIRLQIADGSVLDWIARPGWRGPLPSRDQDVLGIAP
jgi:prepilin-type N-terminal cleavage/methylation domain-containing protein